MYEVKKAEQEAKQAKGVLEVPEARSEAEDTILKVVKKQAKKRKRKIKIVKGK